MFLFFFFNDTATTEIYTLSLHDALPISILDWIDGDSVPRPLGAEDDYYSGLDPPYGPRHGTIESLEELLLVKGVDRKSTRLNSSHTDISRMPSSA